MGNVCIKMLTPITITSIKPFLFTLQQLNSSNYKWIKLNAAHFCEVQLPQVALTECVNSMDTMKILLASPSKNRNNNRPVKQT